MRETTSFAGYSASRVVADGDGEGAQPDGYVIDPKHPSLFADLRQNGPKLGRVGDALGRGRDHRALEHPGDLGLRPVRQQQFRRAAAIERQAAADGPPVDFYAPHVVDTFQADRFAVLVDGQERRHVEIGRQFVEDGQGHGPQVELAGDACRQLADREAETILLRGRVVQHEAAVHHRQQQAARRSLVEPRRRGDFGQRLAGLARERLQYGHRPRRRPHIRGAVLLFCVCILAQACLPIPLLRRIRRCDRVI